LVIDNDGGFVRNLAGHIRGLGWDSEAVRNDVIKQDADA
jgi:hypothetical protein